MYTLITVLIFIVCVLLILIVLVQNSKGGGLASNFQSSGQVMGVRKTADFLEKGNMGFSWFIIGFGYFRFCVYSARGMLKSNQGCRNKLKMLWIQHRFPISRQHRLKQHQSKILRLLHLKKETDNKEFKFKRY